MDEPGSPCAEAPAAASLRRKNKGKAPRPPADTRSIGGSSTFDLETAMMEEKENLDKDIELTVVLPDEVTTSTSVNGSKPMMDLLIFLCSQYHLNPSAYTIDLVSADRTQVKFKPNTPVGMLEVEKVILKPKNVDDKNKKPAAVIPEQTVRVVINYKKTQKAVVRASPHVSLQELIPIISSKCELDPFHTILLKDKQSQEPLEVAKSLNDLGLRELYALDTSRATSATDLTLSSSQESCQISQNVDMQKQKEDEKGFFSFLRRSKKKREQTASAPATPLLTNQRPANVVKSNMVFKPYESNTLPSELPKKRRAPLPPMYASQTVPKDFVQGHTRPQSCVHKSNSIDGEYKDFTGSGIVRTGSLQLSGSSSNESSLRRAKRKAPPPPSPPAQPSQSQMDENSNETAGVVFEYSLEEIDEKEESSVYHKEISESTPLETTDVSIPALSTDVLTNTIKDQCVSMPEHIAAGSSHISKEEKQEPLRTEGKVIHNKLNSTDTGELMLENNTVIGVLDLNKHNDIPENSILIDVPKEDKDNLTRAIEGNSANVTQDITSKEDSKYENDILKTHQFIKDERKVNSTTVVKTQDAAIQTASSHTNDDQKICENIDSEDPGHVKEMGSGHWTVDNKLPLTSISSANQSACAEMEFRAQRRETAVMKESSSAYTKDVFMPTEKNMQSQTGSLSQGNALYRHDAEPKPKASNEITREYIPKIGMTTYKIVPQKSLEIIKSEHLTEDKTLEYDSRLQGLETSDRLTQSNIVYEPAADVRDHHYTASSPTDTNEVSPSKQCTSASQTEFSFVTSNGAPLLMQKKDTTNTYSEKKDKQSDTFHKARTNSFYSQLQRRVSGQYVTSAAAKSITSPTSPTQIEPAHNVTEKNVPLSPQHTVPSTNKTIHSELNQNIPDGSRYERKSEDIVFKPPVMPPIITPKPFVIPSSQSKPLSLQKLRTFTAPRPYSSTTPSPFALAVSSAVRRSQSFSKTSTTSSKPLKGDLIDTFSSAATSSTEVNNCSSERFLGSSDETLEKKMNFTNTENNNKVQYPSLVMEKKSTLSFQNSDPEQVRQSLLAAIRSGEAAAKLKRVRLRPNTITINGSSRLSHSVSTEVPLKQ